MEKKYFLKPMHLINIPVLVKGQRKLDFVREYYLVEREDPLQTYSIEAQKIGFDLGKLTNLGRIFLQYDRVSNTYSPYSVLYYKHNEDLRTKLNIDNVFEYWDLSSLSNEEQLAVINLLEDSIDEFEVDNGVYKKIKKPVMALTYDMKNE